MLLSFALALLLVTVSEPASASLFDIYGYNPRAMAMGSAMTATSDDYTAAYYNPGAMTVSKRVRMGLGLSVAVPDLYVDRVQSGSEHDTVLPPSHVGYNLGWLYPLGGVFDDKVAVGVTLHVPHGRLARVQGIDAQSPQFYMVQNLPDKLVFLAAVAWEPFDGWSIGLGTQILADLVGQAHLALDTLDDRFDRRDLSVELAPTASPVLGIRGHVGENLAVGLAWRGQTALSFHLPVVVSEGEGIHLVLDVAQTVLWTPDQLAFGLAWQLPGAQATLSVDGIWARWSAAPDPSPRLAVDMGGALLDGVGLGDAMDVSTQTEPVALGFRDTFNPRVGVEYRGLAGLSLRAGYGFRPTPAPRQTGVTAYLDNDAHVVTAGAGFAFSDPLGVYVHPLTIDLAVQAQILPRRTVLRDQPHDPIGTLSHGGVVWSSSVAVSYAY